MARGGVREGAGRKVGSTKDPAIKKTHQIHISCTAEQEAELKRRANEQGQSLSAYLLSRALA